MAYVIAAPEMITAAATDLANIASNVNAAHMVAAAPTLAVIPAAADEVSAGITHLFSQHAQGYQALAGQAAAFHEQFVATLHASAGSYAATEAANAAVLQPAALSGLNLNSLLGSALTALGQLLGAIEKVPLPPSLAMLGAQLAVGLGGPRHRRFLVDHRGLGVPAGAGLRPWANMLRGMSREDRQLRRALLWVPAAVPIATF